MKDLTPSQGCIYMSPSFIARLKATFSKGDSFQKSPASGSFVEFAHEARHVLAEVRDVVRLTSVPHVGQLKELHE